MALSLIPLKPDLYPPGSFQIPGEAVTFRVGREGSNDLQVNHSSVSAQHARLETSDGASVDVVDCGSTNGTFVNGIRVERKQLAPGDLLRFATAEFRVTSEPIPPSNGSAGLNGATQTVNLSLLGGPGLQPDSLERERNQLRKDVERLTAEVSEMSGHLHEWQSGVASRDEEIANLSGSLNAQRVSSREQVAA
ncbi:MAG: FHA domain-containing protein, partial [Verrucomicrobiales bacterium]